MKLTGHGIDLAQAQAMGARLDVARKYYVGGSTRKWYPIYKLDNGRICYRNGADMFYPCPLRKNIKKVA